MKLLSVVGARPQFIKAAVLSRALREHWDEVIVHTGQHYDDLMSDVFFRELGLPPPDVNLGVGSASHAVQTARMLEGLEAAYEREKPDLVIVYGDTNSTLAGALAAAKLRLPVAHVEAGFRTYEQDLPEEINRLLTDHVSRYLFCVTENAVKALRREGIARNVHLTGDLMYDSLLAALPHAREVERDVLLKLGLQQQTVRESAVRDPLSLEGEGQGEGPPVSAAGPSHPNRTGSPLPAGRGAGGEVTPNSKAQRADAPPRRIDGEGVGGEVPPVVKPPASAGGSVGSYYLATVHRAATTDDPTALERVLNAFDRLDLPVVLPLHPRTAAAMHAAGLAAPANVRVIDPVGYFEMLALERNARAVLTDSGGVRREAFWLAVPCVTLRGESEWPETVETGWDVLAGTDPEAIVSAARRPRPDAPPPPIFGDGHAAAKIVEILRNDPPNR